MRVESVYYFIQSIVEPVSIYVVEALTDGGHMAVIIFSLLIGGMRYNPDIDMVTDAGPACRARNSPGYGGLSCAGS